ncbi:2-keto-4-pentenoate hydratase/2-oxohepta-3-ene-1,7-dioic acid hydratase (catechol pathway) [Actinopolymorpha cephalotaxi]|uniref:2-keto-4-pentenoate hydratase/2-oxohepta-3-ene-1,7-dioic acid hydratase (Catechol pathway) n=1 Tax=Actinopolymorpha cephalotaxi TaxID=504797 RepID=A0A1I2KQC4_9ACTN|nr:fumarylacetoacetate hydrolase family protein [Actinopolymorpha cephalotaxi]NYH84602.1 2-keto-4-pentenoate hydratase/2-oxohepta-3-ene-1,7-dioic acid hydratase in catechol pathway [Actinopolymorpha cephalotaxi]SFF69212.1 2-keto-4-pentenoate hydratase/2-oxohepta-3-ene-1,7-dioic acid hydratase (catechol pathway) [Actinopolymorpha cephalotaxi]
MQLLRLGAPGAERPAVRTDDGRLLDLSPVTNDIDGAFLAGDGIATAREAVASDRLSPIDDPGDGSGLRVGPPIARPGAVLCIGQNYAAHAAESGDPPPKTPILFFKHPNTVVGPYDDVVVPRGATRTDWEVELGVVIGKTARYLESPEVALEHVAGYVVSNDVSERAFQIEQSGGQWSKGKCAETFNPLGPWLVPADDVDPQKLRLASSVNGEVRQDSTTADMVFDVAYLVWHLSQYLVLDPGDLINTGTPQGVALSGRFPYLGSGDVMELEIDGLGRQRQRLVDA